jgi:hypothetical protein
MRPQWYREQLAISLDKRHGALFTTGPIEKDGEISHCSLYLDTWVPHEACNAAATAVGTQDSTAVEKIQPPLKLHLKTVRGETPPASVSNECVMGTAFISAQIFDIQNERVSITSGTEHAIRIGTVVTCVALYVRQLLLVKGLDMVNVFNKIFVLAP